MIRTRLKPGFDPRLEIPAGSKVAILGCASCGAVYGTSDTRRIEELANQLMGHCEIIFAGTVESPCDQRVLRYFIKNSACAVSLADTVVVMACEAGTRSLGSLLEAMGGRRLIVAPLETLEYTVLGTDGRSTRACLFCDRCDKPPAETLCPVAACPLGRRDGPCQNRPSVPAGNIRPEPVMECACVVDAQLKCPWMTAPAVPAEALSQVIVKPNDCIEIRRNKEFALVVEPGDDIDKLWDTLSVHTRDSAPALIFLEAGRGLHPLAAAALLKVRGFEVPIGLSADPGQMNEAALDSLILSAASMGFKGFYVRESSGSGSPVHQIGSVGLIEIASRHFDPGAFIIVDNAFSHPSDMVLLKRQIDAGAVAAVLRVGSIGRSAAGVSPCPVLEETLVRESVDTLSEETVSGENFHFPRMTMIAGPVPWPESTTGNAVGFVPWSH